MVWGKWQRKSLHQVVDGNWWDLFWQISGVPLALRHGLDNFWYFQSPDCEQQYWCKCPLYCHACHLHRSGNWCWNFNPAEPVCRQHQGKDHVFDTVRNPFSGSSNHHWITLGMDSPESLPPRSNPNCLGAEDCLWGTQNSGKANPYEKVFVYGWGEVFFMMGWILICWGAAMP